MVNQLVSYKFFQNFRNRAKERYWPIVIAIKWVTRFEYSRRGAAVSVPTWACTWAWIRTARMTSMQVPLLPIMSCRSEGILDCWYRYTRYTLYRFILVERIGWEAKPIGIGDLRLFCLYYETRTRYPVGLHWNWASQSWTKQAGWFLVNTERPSKIPAWSVGRDGTVSVWSPWLLVLCVVVLGVDVFIWSLPVFWPELVCLLTRVGNSVLFRSVRYVLFRS